jgi:Holliday junction resolvase-like predicted endonuclease
MILRKKTKKRKQYAGGGFPYVERVMDRFARSMEKSNLAFRKEMLEVNDAFKKSEQEANLAFRKEMLEVNDAFKKSEQEANLAFRKEMLEVNDAFKKSEQEANLAFRKEIRDALAASNEQLAEYKKEWNKKMGEIYNRLGDLAEYTFVPEAILEKFQGLNYSFDDYCRRERILGKDGCARAEYDIVLCNGDIVALVEIKTAFKNEYTDRFIDQISVAANEKYKDKKIIAAIAALEMPKEVKKYAMSQGLYVIEQTGEDIKIETQDGNFKPRIW